VPLFDPNNFRSAEVAALWHFVDLLTECEAVQALAEATGADAAALKASARQRFIIGPHGGPWDADEFTIAELETRFIEFQVYLPVEGGRVVVRSDGSFDRADEGGDFNMIIRRLVRESELAAVDAENVLDGRQAIYLGFSDCISAMEQEAMIRAENRECPRLQAFTRQRGPSFGEKKSESAQGEYLYAYYAITWGDSIGNQ
jgi:hypothetical protein